MNALDMLGFIVGFAAIIAAAYFVTYFLGARTFRLKQTREIKIIDRFALSKDKALYLAQVKGNVYFIAMTHQSAALLDKFDGGEFADSAPKRMSFKDAFAFSAARGEGTPRWIKKIISGGAAPEAKEEELPDTRGETGRSGGEGEQ
ncbi:MAG: flagellar biosynthetic protein FliO [Oscillospiraceae bacterium]|jgi:flagellar biogenesis protein FliO|nr:flagellar biosynthetic protein FliO [Oscillospiraceae bacterium]